MLLSETEPIGLVADDNYAITYNGTDYTCTAFDASMFTDGPATAIGNVELVFGIGDSGEPFLIVELSPEVAAEMGAYAGLIDLSGSTEVTVGITHLQETVHKIPNKYLPKVTVPKNIIDGKSLGSLRTLGANAASEIGQFAFAEGNGTTASGDNSHAEGWYTTASGDSSHAEGLRTVAVCAYSHAEGRYNIEDKSGTYAHIVGNGTADDARSNAHTLDWEGNAWFAGTIKMGGTGQDDENAVEVATKADFNAVLRELNSKVDKPTEEDAMELLYDAGVITPTTDSDGSILTDENGNIFVI